jgi:mycothiol synthase
LSAAPGLPEDRLVIETQYAIEEIKIRTAPDELLREIFELTLELHRESSPEDPEPTYELQSAGYRNLPEIVDISDFIARDATGRLVAHAFCAVIRAGDNEHVAQSGIQVAAGHRRRGVGGRLFAELVSAAEAKRATILAGSSNDRVPAGAEFARSCGAELGQEGHENRLDLGTLDRRLVESWVADGPRRAPGYDLTFIDGAVPDRLIDQVCAAFDVMNTAPRDDLKYEDFHMRPELFREYENQTLGIGGRRWALYARHEADGRFVGFTDITWHPDRPEIVNQGGTAVEPAHRGHALGKWLKAEMVRRIIAGLPDAKFISTGNADSNDAMLGINHQLGFRPHSSVLNWQLSLEQARSSLGSS